MRVCGTVVVGDDARFCRKGVGSYGTSQCSHVLGNHGQVLCKSDPTVGWLFPVEKKEEEHVLEVRQHVANDPMLTGYIYLSCYIVCSTGGVPSKSPGIPCKQFL